MQTQFIQNQYIIINFLIVLCQRATKSLLGMLFTKTVKTDDNAIQASKYSIRYYFALELQQQPVFVLVVFHGNEMVAIDFFFDISVM